MKKGFTLTEAIVVMILMGIIAVLYFIGIKLYDPTQKGNDVKSKKILENLDQTITLILAKHSPMITMECLNDSKGDFSITDSNATKRLADLFKEQLVIMDRSIEPEYITSYYSKPILNYDKTSTGLILNVAFSDFMMSENGTIYGFKLYGNCTSDEPNATPPLSRGKYTVKNICGSIFYDVNAYQGPNKLGADQYIIPIDTVGTEIKKVQEEP